MTIVYSGDETPLEIKGKWSAVVMCWIFGLGTVLSWNIISTLGDYFYEVFPDYHPVRVLTIVYAPLAIAILIIFLCKDTRGDTSKRHLIGHVLFTTSNIGLLVLYLATSGKGGMGKYVGICLLVLVSSIADAHIQGGMIGNLAFMCSEFVQSYVAGMAASGALTSVLRLITKAAFKNVENGLRKGALVFLAISIFFEFQCTFLYAFIFPNIPIVKYYRAKAAREGSEIVTSNLSIVGAEIKFDQHGSLALPLSCSRQHHPISLYKIRPNSGHLSSHRRSLDHTATTMVILTAFPSFLHSTRAQSTLPPRYTRLHSRETHPLLLFSLDAPKL
ncbi:equilibrative nucleotide transporter 3 [Artemisia annua]|uniref:Equilibrative nucleotide transporter 3 n=1 Tax=Artemisia annua TaxID=35608 RepID=A0A2U1L3V5_ARTAN|nr:equilibrative nucleotide transporter 3 [Artemisia annua]